MCLRVSDFGFKQLTLDLPKAQLVCFIAGGLNYASEFILAKVCLEFLTISVIHWGLGRHAVTLPPENVTMVLKVRVSQSQSCAEQNYANSNHHSSSLLLSASTALPWG